MYINNVVRDTFSAIKNIENKRSEIKNIINGIILSCYNSIIEFIKPNSSIKNNFLRLKDSISNIKNNQSEINTTKLDYNEKVNKKDLDESFDKLLAKVKREVKSDEIKESIINDIISYLEEIPTLEKEKITEFKNKLYFHSKWIIFSGDATSLTKIKSDFLETIVDSILNSDSEIKSNFGNVDNYKYFLQDNINNAVEDVLYKN
ncbi:hypothetical protein I6G31_05770 [Proteus penneri]|uniref:hypothetical protein n=1 Tax=Proteus TaxID=583 RepID=UPI000D6DF808|nr:MULTISPECIES: hypothetical protein [Proteus]NBM96584.1 hypothetical protein [Proteus sp. G2660]QPT34889.1 hypothetical protein I6G31_05770 [Proteus penneri]